MAAAPDPAPAAPRLRVTTPDEAYWKRLINCQDACPVHTDSRGYVRAIAAGDYELAYRIARGPNPLASICGRVCGAPCEAACRRGVVDAPIAIRALKRFVTESHGAEAGAAAAATVIERIRAAATPDADREELQQLGRAQAAGRVPRGDGRRVAIIGSGPAGLACGHDLALLGFQPVIFEMEPVPAGMLYLGVPEYRLPRDLIRAEVAVIEALGVEIRCNVKVGRDLAFADLRRDFAAVVIATGAKRSRWLTIPGADAAGIHGGVDFLRAVALGEPLELGRKVVVIGGGNVAFDVGRTVLRQEQYDVSRAALRRGAREVHLCCLESLADMPADDVEIIEGEEEGIVRHNSLGPLEFAKDDAGRVRAVTFQRVVSVYDAERRFAPVFDPTHRTILECDTVLLSVGQAPDLGFLDPERDGVTIDRRGYVACDATSLAASAPGVFVAGDLAHGTKLLIHAVASGKQAARSVYQFLTGRAILIARAQAHEDLGPYRRENGYEKRPRTPIPAIPPAARLREPSRAVEAGYDEAGARREGSRCLDCGVNTIFDGERCILCGGCVDVCPSLCLKLVPVAALELAPEQAQTAAAALGAGWGEGTAIIKDEEACIRCALCAQRCPTGAISMERMGFCEEWT